MTLNVGAHLTGYVRHARWGNQQPIPFTKAALQAASGKPMSPVLTLTVQYPDVSVTELYFVHGKLETLLRSYDVTGLDDLVGLPVSGVAVAEDRSMKAPWLIRLSSYRHD